MRCGGSLTASKVPDAQSAAESADSMMSTVLGGANIIVHAAGWLEGGLCAGYEKLIIDADRLGGYKVMLEGLPMDDNNLGKAAYDDVEPGGHFLGSAHTMQNYETAYYDAEMSDSKSCEQWEEDGSKDTEQRAYERWNQLLTDYEDVKPELDADKDGALLDFIARRKMDIEERWY